jgi:serine protease Do
MKRWPVALVLLVLGGLAGGLLTSTGLHGQAPATTPVPKELTSYRDIVKRVLPAVVTVETRPTASTTKEKTAPRRRPRIEAMPGLPEEFRRFFPDMDEFETPEDAQPQHSFGSGFLIDPKGIVLTNFHVVNGASRVKITMTDGREFTSTDIKGDQKNDLAIVRIKPASPLPYLELGDSDAMDIGDRVLAVGAPFELSGTVTQGIVSAKGRSGLSASRSVYEDYLQTDAAINPGNSGGPLVNLAGQVIGINTAIKSRSGGFQGIGLAISSNVAKNIIDQLIREGVVHRGYLGIAVRPITEDVAEQLGLKGQHGVEVTKVYEGSPAAKAGIKDLDIITEVGGKSIRDARDLQHLVGSLPLHHPVDVTLFRDGKSLVRPVTIEEQPKDFGLVSRTTEGGARPRAEGENVTVGKIGVDLSDLTPEVAERMGYKDGTEGVVVAQVQQGSVASEAGLIRGMRIVKVGKKAVTSAAAARDALNKGSLEKGILLQVQYPPSLPSVGGSSAYIVLRGESAEK